MRSQSVRLLLAPWRALSLIARAQCAKDHREENQERRESW